MSRERSMDFRAARDAARGLGFDENTRDFVEAVFTLHDVLNKVLEQFNASELAFKRAEKARFLGQKGCAKTFRAQDLAFNTALRNTLSGALELVGRVGGLATPNIREQLDEGLRTPSRLGEFRDMMRTDLVRALLADDSMPVLESLYAVKALDFTLGVASAQGFQGLLDQLHLTLGNFASGRDDLSAGRGAFTKRELLDFALVGVKGDDDDDPNHYWGLRWITVLKVIIRSVCYFIIICFIWEDPEYVEELKKIPVCKYRNPEDDPVDDIA